MLYSYNMVHKPSFFSASEGILLLTVEKAEGRTPAKVGIFTVSPTCIASQYIYIFNYFTTWWFQSKNIPQILFISSSKGFYNQEKRFLETTTY